MKAISTFFITALVFSFIFIAQSDTSRAGFFPTPTNPVCCANNNICVDNSLGPFFMCPIGSELVDGSLCDANGECSPVIVPPLETRNVPALSSWGFMSLGVGLAILALGALLLRRRKQHS